MATASTSALPVVKDEVNASSTQPSHSYSKGTTYRHNAAVHPDQNADLQALVKPHVGSFDFLLGQGLQLAVDDLDVVEVNVDGQPNILLWFENVQISYPSRDSLHEPLYPAECREAGTTYAAQFFATVSYQVGSMPPRTVQAKLGQLPIMVKSAHCRLHGLAPAELVRHGEEENEMGGYFICNGNERVIRLLIAPRRNYPMAITRKAYRKRGPNYTDKGVSIRCCRPDQTSSTITLHYLSNGNCNIRFQIMKQEYFIPAGLLLRAFVDTTDRELYEQLIGGQTVVDTFVSDRVEMILRETNQWSGHSRTSILAYLGSLFRRVIYPPSRFTDAQAGEMLLRKYIFVHLNSDRSKHNLLVLMLRKLFLFAKGDVVADNPDAACNQEIYQGGHVYLALLKENLAKWLGAVRVIITRDMNLGKAQPSEPEYMRKVVDSAPNVGQKMEYFLATGNLVTPSGLDMQQASGWTVVADKLNFLRFLSHFRCVHRGRFFTDMKTTTVRKLRPESWGFMCPVHTPDGSPCGLLNHLAAECKLTEDADRALITSLPQVLAALGVTPVESVMKLANNSIPVVVDGCWIGSIDQTRAVHVVDRLRRFKCNVRGTRVVPADLEVALMTLQDGNFFPALYLFTNPARMMRPVLNLRHGKVEQIGTLEQMFLSVACVDDDIKLGRTTHKEIKPNNMLSVIANLTPFSDFNQSPRNMYQCQMGKQTMGTPCHALQHRGDNKIYRIQNPQSALVRTEAQDRYEVNDYPTGANAIVAVISYTGYDMEDAMILNKGAFERGFGHGSVYTHKEVDLNQNASNRNAIRFFDNVKQTAGSEQDRTSSHTMQLDDDEVIVEPSMDKSVDLFEAALDRDGLPHIGTLLRKGDPFYCYFDQVTGEHRVMTYKGSEEAYVDQIRVLNPKGAKSNGGYRERVTMKLRYNRNPVIGDKFSSRHGQKGVCSQMWPQENMPFSESGMTPDIIINPHAFPSRMTIGMLIESMAGKSAALHGIYQDATPFRFDEKHRPAEYFGEQLLNAGYNYYGNEPMYSGIYGTEFKADIYLGVVFYQRLRHMVKDKYQVRSTGPINVLTRQPVKGRKAGGGIRFGEMERDSLLAHGTSYLLNDRLSNCSDTHKAYACRKCGGVLSLVNQTAGDALETSHVTCRSCETAENVTPIEIPYVFRYLTTELAAMNIKVSLDIK